MPGKRSWTSALLLAAACSEDPPPYLDGPVSSTVVASPDGEALYAVNVDEGSVSRYDLPSEQVDTLDLGSEPTRITRSEQRLFVTLRGQREVVALDEDQGGLRVAARTAVGAEPYGIVTSPSGGPVYVAASLE